MARLRIPPPPRGVDPDTARWMLDVAAALSQVAAATHFNTPSGPSTSPGVGAAVGTLGFEENEDVSTKLWVKTGSSDTAWTPVS